ncbi:MAG: hypothetical protein HEEMFOPI_00324 [Holosporales bacterium]
MRRIVFMIAAVSCLYGASDNKSSWTFSQQLHKMRTSDLSRFSKEELQLLKEEIQNTQLTDKQKTFWLSAISRFETQNFKSYDLLPANLFLAKTMKIVEDCIKQNRLSKAELAKQLGFLSQDVQKWADWLISQNLLDEKVYLQFSRPGVVVKNKNTQVAALAKLEESDKDPNSSLSSGAANSSEMGSPTLSRSSSSLSSNIDTPKRDEALNRRLGQELPFAPQKKPSRLDPSDF